MTSNISQMSALKVKPLVTGNYTESETLCVREESKPLDNVQ